MLAPATGLARITIRAPHRRVDLAVPYQVPLAELLPEVVVRAGEVAEPQLGAPTGGWMLRRADGAPLVGDRALAAQGVRDGDVLYLVPRRMAWPEPVYDDVIEEIAAEARGRSRTWDASATRAVALVAVALILSAGLVVLVLRPPGLVPGLLAAVVSALLAGTATIVARGFADPVVAVVTGGCALAYAGAAGWLLVAALPGQPLSARILVAGCALLVTAVVAAAAIGEGLPLFTGGVVGGVATAIAGFLGLFVGPTGAVAIVVAALVASVGLVPWVAVRAGRLPLPAVTADPVVIAGERRPDRGELGSAVVRAERVLIGCLSGLAIATLSGIAFLATAADVSSGLLAVVASFALLLRARVYPGVPARTPLLLAGALGLVVTVGTRLPDAGAPAALIVLAVGSVVVMALLGVATVAGRRQGTPSPYLSRIADVADIGAVVLLAPLACAVLGLFGFARNLAG